MSTNIINPSYAKHISTPPVLSMARCSPASRDYEHALDPGCAPRRVGSYGSVQHCRH
jgi:hypothetical protein